MVRVLVGGGGGGGGGGGVRTPPPPVTWQIWILLMWVFVINLFSLLIVGATTSDGGEGLDDEDDNDASGSELDYSSDSEDEPPEVKNVIVSSFSLTARGTAFYKIAEVWPPLSPKVLLASVLLVPG